MLGTASEMYPMSKVHNSLKVYDSIAPKNF